MYLQSYLLKILALSFILTAIAQPTGADPQQPPKLIIKREVCDQLLVDAIPSADTNFTPGVDVDGNPVVSGDLTNNSIKLPDSFNIDLTMYQLNKFPNIKGNSLLLPQFSAGTVTFNMKDNQVYYNGKPIGESDQNALRDLCRKLYQKGQS